MGEANLFIFGILVVIIFSIGIVFTVREFREMDQEEQRNYRDDSKISLENENNEIS